MNHMIICELTSIKDAGDVCGAQIKCGKIDRAVMAVYIRSGATKKQI